MIYDRSISPILIAALISAIVGVLVERNLRSM